MAHTPGPWTIGKKPRLQPYIEGADGTQVCSCGGNAPGSGAYTTETFRRRDANARIIAAAPDLLGAAKAAGEWLSTRKNLHRDDDAFAVFSRIIAAVVKAEGQS